tara:strand:- start:66 stop:317 length:252 start_codon:yes stop_codon:yes gene_type:complete
MSLPTKEEIDKERERQTKLYGKIWTTSELTLDFEVIQFMAPYVQVRRKSDGIVGTLVFSHMPRTYFGFVPDTDSNSGDNEGGK